MKRFILLLALAGCATNAPNTQPWFCEDYEAEAEKKPVGCASEVNPGWIWDGKRYIPLGT